MASLTHWHILGAGSLGCLWACYLAKAGHIVTLIARDDMRQAELLDALPLTLVKDGQRFQAKNIQINSLSSISYNPPCISHLLVCLKTWQTPAAIATIKPALHSNATVVLMQNGMGNQALLPGWLPDCANYAAITTEAACKQDKLTVEHTGTGITQLGALGNKEDQELAGKLHCELTTAIQADIESALWQKLVVNCCINPLTAIYHCKNGELAHNKQVREQISAIINECKAVANAIDKAHYLDGIEPIVASVIKTTAANTSSMLQDILQQRTTEIDQINGYISHLGKQYNIATPANNQLITMIKKGEQHA